MKNSGKSLSRMMILAAMLFSPLMSRDALAICSSWNGNQAQCVGTNSVCTWQANGTCVYNSADGNNMYQACIVGTDCSSGNCGANGLCAAPEMSDYLAMALLGILAGTGFCLHRRHLAAA